MEEPRGGSAVEGYAAGPPSPLVLPSEAPRSWSAAKARRASAGDVPDAPGGGGVALEAAATPRVSLWRASPFAKALRSARASNGGADDPSSPAAAAAAAAAGARAAGPPPLPLHRRGASPEPEAEAEAGEADSGDDARSVVSDDDYAEDLERLVEAAAAEEDSPLAASALESLQGILDYTLRCAALSVAAKP
jgi:hypothetical protein